jgi:hypothetical protein
MLLLWLNWKGQQEFGTSTFKKMKMKYFISLTILLIGTRISFAQTNQISNTVLDTTENFRNQLFESGRVTFGLKAGYTHGNFYGSEIDDIFADGTTQWISGFHVGILVNSEISDYFWLKHELIFSQRGAVVALFDSLNGNYSSKLKTYYVDLYPLNLTFHYKGFQLYGGPYISLLTYANIQRKNDNGVLFNDESIFGDASQFEDNSKYLQKFDFGMNFGIEYQFPFGLFIGAKYNHGFTDIFQYANSYTLNDPKTTPIKIYNRAFLFSVGYSFCK